MAQGRAAAAESRACWARLLAQGWTDAIRHLHPEEPVFTFWDYFRQHWQRNAGLRIDHLLLNRTLAPSLRAAGVDPWVRGEEKASDHAPAWVELAPSAGNTAPPAIGLGNSPNAFGCDSLGRRRASHGFIRLPRPGDSMKTTAERALLLEALSDKVLHRLPPAVWKQLFLGPGSAKPSVSRNVTSPSCTSRSTWLRASLAADHAALLQELQRLNTRHNGRLDPYVDAAALAAFENPGAAVRMAIELQRAADGIALRVGVVSGVCTLAFFRVQGRLWCTPLGAQAERAAAVAGHRCARRHRDLAGNLRI